MVRILLVVRGVLNFRSYPSSYLEVGVPEHGEEDGRAGAEDGLVRREPPLVGGRRRVGRAALFRPAY